MKNTLKTTSAHLSCYHCGEQCADDYLTRQDKVFCCSGCRIVYELLDENNLCTYYELEEQPGINLGQMFESDKFTILDDREVLEQLIDFRDDNTTHITLSIPAIHCTSCVWLLENLHQLAEGVIESRVHFLRKEIKLIYQHNRVSLRKLAELLAKTGYEPTLQLQNLYGRQTNAHPNRRLWLQLGVAGFAFGNIMLLSFPEYLTNMAIDASMRAVFGFLSILLALPVLFFSSIDYLKSAWNAVKNKGINLNVPITLGITALFGRSLYEIISGVGTGYLDSFSGFIFLLLIGRMLQKKTFEHLNFNRDYRSYFPISSLVIEEGEEKNVSINNIRPGDQLRIRNREIIPTDAILKEDAHIDYSFVTGESDPVMVKKGETVYAGGRVLGNSTRLIVTKKVDNSRLTELWNNSQNIEQPADAFMTALADRISPWFTGAVISIAFLAAGYWTLIDGGLAANVFTAVLIVACPCALALSSPFTFGSALNVLSANGLFVKNTSALERLACTDTIVFDKTGTLTRQDKMEINYEGKTLSGQYVECFKNMFQQSAHPLSRSVLKQFSTLKLSMVTRPDGILNEVKNPYTPESSRKFQEETGLENFKEYTGKGIQADMNGKNFIAGSYAFLKKQGYAVEAGNEREIEKGSVIYIGINGELIGRIILRHAYRNGLKEVLTRLKQGLSLHLLTGDNEQAAGLLAPLFGTSSQLLFNQTPIRKQQFIEELKQQGQKVLMIGDGLNDAGAIKSSHFGVSLTEQASSFSPACDAIMEASLFEKLDRVISFGKGCITIIWFSFGISLLYNLIGLGFAVTGKLTPLVAAVIMPLSSISIMIFTTLSTRFLATSKGLKLWK